MTGCWKCDPGIPDALAAVTPLCLRCSEDEIGESVVELAQRIACGLSRKQYQSVDFVYGGPIMQWRRGMLRWAGY